jgi:3-deoxy-D-manno-octulosonic-acid transferase
MKWDAVPPDAPAGVPPAAERLADELGIDRSRSLIVAGSTAPIPGSSEEALLHAACPPGVQLLCAPRKPEHRDAAFEALGGPGRCIRRSSRGSTPPTIGADRFLLDTLGELGAAYALADVAVVGRSFGTLRGSDPIEPIALGKPTIIGPAHANFEHIVGRFRGAGAIRVCHPSQLGPTLAELLNTPDERDRLAAAGRACIAAERGATARHAALLLGLLSKEAFHHGDSEAPRGAGG